jgi:beta-galactosidase
MDTFTIDDKQFLLNNKPFRILAGAMHYFRVLPEYWENRLAKLRPMGLNTLETYVAWNLHESKPGQFDFDGRLDLVAYIQRAAEAGLKVIVRPGPYICAEWEFGGFPAWLLKDPNMKLRCLYQPYLDAVDRFFDALLPKLVPFQISHGGPIIAMQVENEYGSYGNDYAYLQYLEHSMRARGIDVLLFTSDGPTDEMLQYGTLSHIFKIVNFGSKAREGFQKLREYQPTGPLMCMEFWNGWFDHWGEQHHRRAPEDAAAALDEILSTGASVNLYMFHGGTNFGFMNGANFSTKYEPTVTSYDDDAPVNEAGDITPKYLAFRKVISQYSDLPDLPVPQNAPKMSLDPLELTEAVDLFAALDTLSCPIKRPTPEPMEMLGQNYGFILYRTQVTGPRAETPLTIREPHDRAHVFVDGQLIGILEREAPDKKLNLSIPPRGITLEILVENMGRINYGPELHDRKGITAGVLLGQQYLFNWTIFPLPLDDLSGLHFSPAASTERPAFYRGRFVVTAPHDTFLTLDGWTKGVCWINGFNLGRYWARGPQKTLYVPAPLLHKGENELIILELSRTTHLHVWFCDQPYLA